MVYDPKQSLAVAASKHEGKVTFYLLLCSFVCCLASFQFGYNVGVINLQTHHIKQFYVETSKKLELEQVRNASRDLEVATANLTEYEKTYEAMQLVAESKFSELARVANQSSNKDLFKRIRAEYEKDLQNSKDAEDELNSYLNLTLAMKGALKDKTQSLDNFKTMLWTITNCLFVVGGMVGAIISKFFSDVFGRRNSIVFHNMFAMAGAIATLLTSLVNHWSLLKVSRFLFGVQGGMAISLIPSYLNEISPPHLRGIIGVTNQLLLTFGSLVSQILGLEQLLGSNLLWKYLLALPVIPALIGSLCLYFFFPETPHDLLKQNDDEAAEKALKRLRNSDKVTAELEQIKKEVDHSSGMPFMSIPQLIKDRRLRLPLIAGIIILTSEQLSGISAIGFYSNDILRDAGISQSVTQYSVILFGVIGVLSTLIAVPMIDKLGRKPLLVGSMVVIVVDFVALTTFLKLGEHYSYFSYLGVVCVLIYLVSFAIGLGPVPFLFVAECFEPNSKSAALSLGNFIKTVFNLLLVVAFPYLIIYMGPYVFLVFAGIVFFALIFTIIEIPETKGKTAEQLIAKFNEGRFPYAQTKDTDSVSSDPQRREPI